MNFDYKNVVEQVKNKKILSRSLILILGVFIMALNYNLFVLPNNLVLGGASGLAIIFKNLFSWNPNITIYVINGILIIVSFIFLGKSITSKTLVGSILYPFFISITTPLATKLLPHFNFDNFLIVILIAGLLSGLSNGLVYKTGFTTGGSDTIMKILSKYFHIPTGKGNFITNIIIIGFGGIIFGVNNVVYAIIILYISSALIDRILIGISDSKMFFIYSKYPDKIKEYILHDISSGVTVFEAEGGFSKEKGKMLMCVVATRDYYEFKEGVLLIDPNAFFVINDCYEVSGGVKRTNLPFI